ncbi:MAG TPA: DUF697 domain-containing protein [Xanthobacteraceae bacterium]|jgi:uncharacterized protein (DUF697 family)
MANETFGSTGAARKDPVAIATTGATDGVGITPDERAQAAAKLVDRFSLWSGVAGLIPLPFVDVATVAGLQLQLLRRLSSLYGVAFSENLGKSVIASLMGSMIPASSGMGVASALKGVPAIGTGIGTLTMSAVAAGATYAIGKVFIQHFTSGGTLLDFNPPDYREFIKAQKSRWNNRAAAVASAARPTSSGRAGKEAAGP